MPKIRGGITIKNDSNHTIYLTKVTNQAYISPNWNDKPLKANKQIGGEVAFHDCGLRSALSSAYDNEFVKVAVFTKKKYAKHPSIDPNAKYVELISQCKVHGGFFPTADWLDQGTLTLNHKHNWDITGTYS